MELVIQKGPGIVWGVSNDVEQPGKQLTILDEGHVLFHCTLDHAFPDRVTIREDGTKELAPGYLINTHFTECLQLRTNGKGRVYHR